MRADLGQTVQAPGPLAPSCRVLIELVEGLLTNGRLLLGLATRRVVLSLVCGGNINVATQGGLRSALGGGSCCLCSGLLSQVFARGFASLLSLANIFAAESKFDAVGAGMLPVTFGP
jgi:hypothetical protein